MMLKQLFYPIYGIIYFVNNPVLWKSCLKGLFLTFLFAIGSLIGLSFLVKPTASFLTYHSWPSWLSYITAILFLLVESAVAVISFSLIIIPILLDEVFEKVLKLKGLEKTVLIPQSKKRTIIRSTASGILFGLTQILVLLITFPINLIPLFGTILYCCINGYFLAWGYMMPHLSGLKGMSFNQSRKFVSNNKYSFINFGTIAFTLELIPLLNWIFIFTNAIGAGLWASDEWEKELSSQI